MTQDVDKFAIERRLVQLNGLAQALALMAHSPDFQEDHRDALGGMAEAFEEQQRALWRLVFGGGEFPRASDPPKAQP